MPTVVYYLRATEHENDRMFIHASNPTEAEFTRLCNEGSENDDFEKRLKANGYVEVDFITFDW